MEWRMLLPEKVPEWDNRWTDEQKLTWFKVFALVLDAAQVQAEHGAEVAAEEGE